MAAQPIITEEKQAEARASSREERGRQIFEERYNEITHVAGDEWYVPASALLDGRYVVRLGDNPSCECPDHEYRGATCKHIIAATIANAKSRTCSCCSRRVLGRFTEEVTEDDELLSWFPGDELCVECIRAGYWV